MRRRDHTNLCWTRCPALVLAFERRKEALRKPGAGMER